MAKRAKQRDADGDDDVYLEVKQEVFGTANRQKNLAPQETRETPTPKTSTPKRYPETEATPPTAKFSKETKAALKIVRKHAPSTPLFKTAVSMITEHVLANKMDQPTSSLRRNTFGFIEEELSRKSTPDVKTNLVIEHVRAEVGCALARTLANVIENKSDLDKALSTIRSAAEERIPGIAKGSTTGDSGRDGKASKRKRAISEVEARKTRPKALKVDESSSAEDDAQNNRAEKDFDLDKFMIYYKKEKAAVYAKRHFVNSERLFDFHVKQLRSTTGYETTKISSPVWSALSAQQKGEWQSLLAALHQGSKEPVGGQGKTLLERQQAKSLSNASAKTADSSSSSSSSDDSGSDEDTASNASTARDSANTSSASQTTYTTDGSARPDFKRVDKRSWSDEENRILLKGLRCGWTNERIQSELPPNSRRTLGAISCAKSAMKKKYLNGLPASQADLPLSVSPASSKRSPQPVSRTAAAPRDTVDGQTKTIAVSVVAPRPVDVPPDAPIGPRTSPKPTFVGWRSRPIGPATQGIEYLLLPIDTPECPVTNARPEDVTEACSQAFGGYSSFQSAHKIEDALWQISPMNPP
ncbi:hypothetical protein CKM354_001284400 [Cercospora kikuchii]|uniref:Uncharacterized protein n=1 Tax=Cercospora kikuchii TaxID=84275 RepID=A0A9P3FMR3_9PEZI|nr:uncharacterized protein CKM354_001284400 [Cercospora kikuchii]GIZ49820.1 hypothetical protein CKM354_001284400 [Cercospora kikuchii]